MNKLYDFLVAFFSWSWKLFHTACTFIANIFVLIIVLVLLIIFVESPISVPDGSALVLSPAGDIVEKTTATDPVSKFINGFVGIPVPEETLLQDILDVIDTAGGDDRIEMLVLYLAELDRCNLNQLQAIGHGL